MGVGMAWSPRTAVEQDVAGPSLLCSLCPKTYSSCAKFFLHPPLPGELGGPWEEFTSTGISSPRKCLWEIGFGLAGQRCWVKLILGAECFLTTRREKDGTPQSPLVWDGRIHLFSHHSLWSTQRSTHTACGWKTLC